jgi:hypothetical protein
MTSCTPIDHSKSPQVIEQQVGQELPSRSLVCMVRTECIESIVFRALLCQVQVPQYLRCAMTPPRSAICC